MSGDIALSGEPFLSGDASTEAARSGDTDGDRSSSDNCAFFLPFLVLDFLDDFFLCGDSDSAEDSDSDAELE